LVSKPIHPRISRRIVLMRRGTNHSSLYVFPVASHGLAGIAVRTDFESSRRSTDISSIINCAKGALPMGWFNGAATASGRSLMERLSHEVGWTPDAMQGDAIAHFFPGDAITPRRDVIIYHSPGQPIAVFSCVSRARFAARSMTAAQLALFLARNKESVFGSWEISIEDGVVTPRCSYTALTAGLDAGQFKVICANLIGQVAYVEEALHEQGTL
jgi:hypothetical protein